MNKFMRYQGPAWLWAILIFIGSSIPGLSAPDLGFQWEDKLAHLLEFAIFGFVLMRAFSYSKRPKLRQLACMMTLIIGAFYAVTDELHQWIVPGRSADLADWIADGVGILLGQGIYYFLYHLNFFKQNR